MNGENGRAPITAIGSECWICGEDLELGYRLNKAGIKFIYNPYAIGYHNHIKTFTQFCLDMEKAGESLILIYRKCPEIKMMKKIDIVEDEIKSLKGSKKIIKIILSITIACPWILLLPRLIIRGGENIYMLRFILFPLYYWLSQFHYAVGMRRGLAK